MTTPRGGRPRKPPETREALIERLTNPEIAVREAAILLGVGAPTVRRWADTGRLRSHRTPGNQRRFRLRDVLALGPA